MGSVDGNFEWKFYTFIRHNLFRNCSWLGEGLMNVNIRTVNFHLQNPPTIIGLNYINSSVQLSRNLPHSYRPYRDL